MKTYSNQSNARRAITKFRERHPELSSVELDLDGTGIVATLPARATKAMRDLVADLGFFIREPKRAAASEPRRPTKASVVVEMLSRPGGATVDEIMKATDWLPHTARAFISVVGKKHRVESARDEDRGRVYRITA